MSVVNTSFVFGNEAVAPGAYRAKFVRVDAFEENPEFGPAMKLVWQILDGKYAGTEVTRVVSFKTGPKANLPKFAQMIGGSTLASGQEFDFAMHFGVIGTAVVELTESGASRVASFIREDLTNGD